MHGAGATHAAHHLVQDQQRAMAIADPADPREVAGEGGHAAGGGADHGFRQERHHGVRAKPLKLVVQFVDQPIQILSGRFAGLLEAIGEARRHQTVRLA